MPYLFAPEIRPAALLILLASCAAPPREARAPVEPRVRSIPAVPRQDEPAVPTEVQPVTDLAARIAYAEAHHPAIAAAWQEVQAALELAPQARGLPDTQLTYRYGVTPIETRVGPQRQGLGLRQPLPWFGRLAQQGEVAERGAQVVLARFEGRRLAVRAEVQRAYAEQYWLARSTEIVRANVALYRELDSVLRRRYGVGAAQHPDLIRGQVELGKLEDRLRSLVDRRAAVDARMNAALGRPADAPIGAPGTLALEREPDAKAAVARWMESSNPELAALTFEAERQHAAVAAARKLDRPDFSVGLEWLDVGESITPGQADSGQDAWYLSLGIELPVARAKNRAARREAHARRAAALEGHEALRLELAARAEGALFGLRDAERQVDLYKGALLPKARESLEATQKAFGLGTETFLDLVDAQRVLLEFELTYERAITNHLEQRAALERLVGRPLSEVDDMEDAR